MVSNAIRISFWIIAWTILSSFTFEDLTNAMIQVESRGNLKAYNDSEKAAGVLQIRPIMVAEVNRILELRGSTTRYHLDDRWSRECSIEMLVVYASYHADITCFETVARTWNGGPGGMNKNDTVHYWSMVCKAMGKNKTANEKRDTESISD